MHFLCLHGIGTNSKVFEMQTGKLIAILAVLQKLGFKALESHPTPPSLAAIRYELGDHHSYEFVEGTVPCPPDPGIKPFLTSGDTYFGYFDNTSAEGFRKAVDAFDAYIFDEGPFDGVIAFSQGALLTSTLLARQEKAYSKAERDGGMKRPFKCAVFFSGGVPVAYDALLGGEIRTMEFATEGEIISIPTAHVWGSQDTLWPGRALALSEMCSSNMRTVYIHDGGHEVPGSKSKAAVTGVVHVIRKTIDQALFDN